MSVVTLSHSMTEIGVGARVRANIVFVLGLASFVDMRWVTSIANIDDLQFRNNSAIKPAAGITPIEELKA